MDDATRRYVPRHRLNSKPLEKKREALERLSKKRQETEKILKAKKDAFLQTGDEYFFQIYSTYVKNKKVYRDTRPDSRALKRALLYVNAEIKRSEKKMLAYVPEPKGIHIRYCDGNDAESMQDMAKNDVIDCTKSSEERRETAEYMHKLQDCRAEILRQLKLA
eukprot:jgi/Antlo1/881/440